MPVPGPPGAWNMANDISHIETIVPDLFNNVHLLIEK